MNTFQTKSLCPKFLHIQPGLVLWTNDCPILPAPMKQRFSSIGLSRSLVAKLAFVLKRFDFDTYIVCCGTVGSLLYNSREIIMG
jgi:hypothetical protein